MLKTVATLAVLLCFSTITFVSAEVTQAPNTADGANLVGEVLGVVALVVIFAVIGYAGYRMVKKWSSSSSSD
jgi:hypothetical protein